MVIVATWNFVPWLKKCFRVFLQPCDPPILLQVPSMLNYFLELVLTSNMIFGQILLFMWTSDLAIEHSEYGNWNLWDLKSLPHRICLYTSWSGGFNGTTTQWLTHCLFLLWMLAMFNHEKHVYLCILHTWVTIGQTLLNDSKMCWSWTPLTQNECGTFL